eukprot:scaffold259_cov252-Pinguiococcus_pyrenoidosus.AAC.29
MYLRPISCRSFCSAAWASSRPLNSTQASPIALPSLVTGMTTSTMHELRPSSLKKASTSFMLASYGMPLMRTQGNCPVGNGGKTAEDDVLGASLPRRLSPQPFAAWGPRSLTGSPSASLLLYQQARLRGIPASPEGHALRCPAHRLRGRSFHLPARSQCQWRSHSLSAALP